ncbi:MAG: efflux RND transporter periplasmic adaptor subunit, partial [Bdellovibrionales bacterium]
MSAKTLKIAVAIVAIGALASGAVYMMNGPQDAQASQEAQNAGQAPQAMPVSVTTVTPQKIQLWKNFSGHVVAVDQAQIKPQVSGRITEIRFEDGGHVDKGDILIVIDPRPYEAKVNQAKALLDAAQTQSSLAEKEYQRAVQLIDSDAIAQSVMDTRVNNRRTAAAALQGAKATLEAARVDLDYAYIKAPIAGKISRAEMTQGNLVQSGPNAPVLTSIVADEKVYADFEVDEATYIATLKGGAAALSDIPVRLQVPGADQEYLGTVQSFDNRIDQATGTIRARAIFDNANGLLLPG